MFSEGREEEVRLDTVQLVAGVDVVGEGGGGGQQMTKEKVKSKQQ